MAWKTINGCDYYYDHFRLNGRHVTRYVGGGALGQLVAMERQHARIRARLAREKWETSERDPLIESERSLVSLGRQADHLAAVVLSGLGFHRYRRQWRYHGMSTLPSTLPVPDPAAFRGLMRRYREHTTPSAILSLGREWGRNDQDRERRFHSHLTRIRAELSGESPSLMVGLLVARVLACFVDTFILDTLAFQARAEPSPPYRHEYLDRRRSRAHKRFLQATEALTRTRKMLSRSAVRLTVASMGPTWLEIVGSPGKAS